jgi:hypothetical protein
MLAAMVRPFIFQPYPVYSIDATLQCCHHVVSPCALFSRGYLCQATLFIEQGKKIIWDHNKDYSLKILHVGIFKDFKQNL